MTLLRLRAAMLDAARPFGQEVVSEVRLTLSAVDDASCDERLWLDECAARLQPASHIVSECVELLDTGPSSERLTQRERDALRRALRSAAREVLADPADA